MVIIHIRVSPLPLSSWWPGQTINVCFLLLFFWLTAHLVKILQESVPLLLPSKLGRHSANSSFSVVRDNKNILLQQPAGYLLLSRT